MRIKVSALTMIALFLVSAPTFAQGSATKTFTTDDKSFTFDYPADWTVQPDQGPISEITIDNLPVATRIDSVDALEVSIALPVKPSHMPINNAKTPKEAVAQLAIGVSQGVARVFGTPSANETPQPLQTQAATPDVKEFLVNGRSAAYTYNIMQAMGRDYSQLEIIADLGNGYWVQAYAYSFKGGLKTIQKNATTILEIAKSMRYSPPPPVYSGNPDLPQVYSGLVGISERGYLKFFYPKDWYVGSNFFITLSNEDTNGINTKPDPGQFIAAINGVNETVSAAAPLTIADQCKKWDSSLTAKKLVATILGNTTTSQLDQMKKAGITITQPEVTTVNGVEIVYFRQYQNNIEALAMYIDLGGGNIESMSVYTNKGDMAKFEKQLFAVASTFQYTPKPCDSQDGIGTATPAR